MAEEDQRSGKASFAKSLVSGGVAGMTVDISLYPLDTLKTRLQSPQGFIKAGGFKGIYAGLGAAAVGSAPGAALFFSSYESAKSALPRMLPASVPAPVVHMLAASFGEAMACLVRVPTEVVKQRYQAKVLDGSRSLVHNVQHIVRSEGVFGGLYKGYGITIMREIPFAWVQFPLYEWMKIAIRKNILHNERDVYAHEAALCGSVSGGLAAAVTTPLDVLKTRLMLGADRDGVAYKGALDTFYRLREECTQLMARESLSRPRAVQRVFFAGVEPRVMWISIGGFVFFGAYEQARKLCDWLW